MRFEEGGACSSQISTLEQEQGKGGLRAVSPLPHTLCLSHPCAPAAWAEKPFPNTICRHGTHIF